MDYNSRRMDELKLLFSRTRTAIDSDRNRTNEKKWRREAEGRHPDGAFRVFLGASYFSRAFGVNMRDYYFDPILYLETNLKLNLLAFEKFQDDVPLTNTIAWNPGVTMEPSFFGVTVHYQEDKEAWEAHGSYLLRDYSDLASIAEPNFYKTEAMRHIHQMYEQLCEITMGIAPDFSISFPRWHRSPFANACSLRGMEELCCDFYENPEFVHELMGFVTRARMKWEDACTAFLGEKPTYRLGNDEVNCPLVSPQQYAEFILPYEEQLLQYYGKLDYFHSCGNLTPLIPYIKRLNPLMFHVSPWTDLKVACDAFSGTKTILDVWAHVTDEVMYASAEHTQQVMAERYKICRAADIGGFLFNSGNMQQVTQSVQGDDEKILQWVNACRLGSTQC